MQSESPLDRRWKYPVVPSVIREDFERPDTGLVSLFAAQYVPDVCDAVGRMYTVRGVRSLFEPAIPVVGPALTVRCPPGDNFGVKTALTLARPGDVLVVDGQGFSDWCLGGFQMLQNAIHIRGLKGLIVYGAYRDAGEARSAGFPIYATGIAPWSGPKLGPVEINVPVGCGGVIVHPGDIICASEEGIAVVPQAYAARVAEAIETKTRAKTRTDLVQDTGSLETSQDAALHEYIDRMVESGLCERTSGRGV